jgi:MFS family permease
MTPASGPARGPDRGMDWLTLLLAGGGSAYGAFIPVYLTSHAWTQTRIGLVLTVSTVIGMLCQVPAGLLVDAIGPRRRTALYWAIVAAGLVPMVFVLLPRGLPVLLAMAVQAAAGSVFTPAVAAISLALVGRDGLGERVGRNGRYGSIGAGMGAAVMGACGYMGSPRVAFVVAAALTVPALLALRAIGPDRLSVVPMTRKEERPGLFTPFVLLRDRRLLIYALCVALFQVASIAVLQLSAVDVTAGWARAGPW